VFHRLAGTAFAVAFVLFSGSLFGGNLQRSIRTLAYDESTTTVSGMTAASTYEAVRHFPTTLNQMIGDPDWIPDDSEIGDPDWYVCRDVAQQWNVAVLQSRNLSTFRELLARSASAGCKIEYVRNNLPDANGAYELLVVRPLR
jgi:hypothetical protein